MSNKKKYGKLSIKITAIFVALLILTSLAAGFSLYNISRANVFDEYKYREFQSIEFVTAHVKGEYIEKWLHDGTDELYDDLYKEFKLAKKMFGLEYLYVSVPILDDDGNMTRDVKYIFDVMGEGDNPDFYRSFGDIEKDVDVYDTQLEITRTKEITNYDVITVSEYGYLLSNYGPLMDETGKVVAFVGADIDMHDVLNDIQVTTFRFVFFYCLLMLAFSVLFILFMNIGIVKPVKTLSDSMNRFVSNGADLVYEPVTGIHTRDEIEQMSDDFNSMARSIVDYTDNLAHSTAEKERMKADLDVSTQIRDSISAEITYPAFPERNDFELYASIRNTVFNKCSFCNYFFTDESHLFITIGEPMGKSLASMLMAMLASTNIQCFAKMGYSPYRIATETNNQLCNMENSSKELSVGVIIAEIDLRLGAMKYVNAGMPPLLIKRIGESYEFQNDAVQFGIGEMRGISFTQETLKLQQGISVFFSSYGVSEMKNADGAKFTIERLRSEINSISDSLYDLKEMTDELENRLNRFRGKASVEIDTATCTFRYFG